MLQVNMEAISFRKYSSHDLAELSEMVLGLYTKDGTKHSHMSHEKVALSVEMLTGPGSTGQVFLFEKNECPVGYAIVNRFWSNEFSGFIQYIDELFVKSEFRNLGIGADFFRFLEAMPQYDSVAFMLETVRDNEKAIRFYQKIGFDTHHNHLMFKNLAKK